MEARPSHLPHGRGPSGRLPAGSAGGRFVVVAELGRGGAGVVYRARDLVAQREVALKVLLDTTPERAERFRREAQVASRLDHPGIVRVLDSGVENGRAFITYELVPGAHTLAEVLAGCGTRRAVELLRDAAEALGYAHGQGVVHRDVKEENILVDVAGQVRVTDFGVAMAGELERLTRTGTLVGTPYTMAPEQVEGRREAIGPTTDVWALGVILYRVLAGSPPFLGPSLADLLEQIGRAALPPLPDGVDRTLAEACRRALRRDPAERYPDGAAFAAVLAQYLQQRASTLSGTVPAFAPRRLRATTAAAALLLAAVGLTAGLLVTAIPTATEPPPDETTTEPVTTASEPPPAHSPRASVADPTSRTHDHAGEPSSWRERLRAADRARRGTEAEAILRDAAERGDPAAMNDLGFRLQTGQGIPQDQVEAARWYRRGADAGDLDAMRNLGFVTQHGWGVPLDHLAARAWYERAIAAGDPFSPALLGYMHMNGQGGPRDLARAVELYRQGAEHDPLAAYNLGVCYENGDGVDRDLVTAVDLYRRAAEAGNAAAMTAWGWAQDEGQGVPVDFKGARRWYLRAVDEGERRPGIFLGRMHEEGRGVAVDLQTAIRWYRLAAEDGYPTAMTDLGRLLIGQGGDAAAEGVEWCRRAANAGEGDREAMRLLGLALRDGRGVAADPSGARAWLERAASLGDEGAREVLEAGDPERRSR